LRRIHIYFWDTVMTDFSLPSVVEDNPERNRLEYVAHCEMAVVEYSVQGDVITFLHTRVPEVMRGQGVGKTLVRAGLDAARERGQRVIPQCPLFAAYMKEHPETQDLLADEGRAMLGL
jgi:predicted GNAT family acetyltransferase